MEQLLELMKKDEAEKSRILLVSMSDLPEGYEGTLLYGYNFDRTTLHVYAKNGEIHALTYRGSDQEVISHHKGETLSAEQCVPEKRFYFEPTQAFFLELLMNKVALPCHTSNGGESLEEGEFYSKARVED